MLLSLNQTDNDAYDFDYLGFFEFHNSVKSFKEQVIKVKLIPLSWEIIDYSVLVCIDSTDKKVGALILREVEAGFDPSICDTIEYNKKYYELDVYPLSNVEFLKCPFKQRLSLDPRYNGTDSWGDILGLFYKGKKIRIVKYYNNPKKNDFRFYVQTLYSPNLIYYKDKIYYNRK